MIPILELKQDGDIAHVNIKQANPTKAALKDLQTYLKKKTTPTLLVTYPYGSKHISLFGYVKGKETELSQHQLPPPCEVEEIYGSIILIAHSAKSWETSVELFSPDNYEVFYQKACDGELEVVDPEDEDTEEDEAIEEVEEEVLEEDVLEDVIEEDLAVEEEEEPVVRATRVARKVKVDPQQLQFQFKSTLLVETEVSALTVAAVKQRQHTVDVFKTLVGEHCSDDDILQLEMGIYNASLDEAKKRLVPLTWDHETFVWIYMMISKRTASNFQPTSYVGNSELIARWKEGEFTLDSLGHWTPYELQPSHWKDLKDQQFRREQRILEGNLAMATDRFRCSRCKKKQCSYYELQTRSADEPMTIFISCLVCGKQWKQ
jgi:hypothetical protein